MTIAELLAERPDLRVAADILIRGGTHVDDVVRALLALPSSASAAIERSVAFVATHAPAPSSVAPRRSRSAEEIAAMWDQAMSRAMAAAGLMQAQPQPAMHDQPSRSRNVSAMWDAAMAKATAHLGRAA